MSPHANDQYLATEVMTATPQKLHLMLIEAAIRSSMRAAQLLSNGQPGEASEALIRAQEIVSEIISGIQPDTDGDLGSRVTAIYNFIYRRLIEAHLEHSVPYIHEAVRILGEERTTWMMLCEQLGSKLPTTENREATAPATVPVPHVPLSSSVQMMSEGLSFEA